MSDYVFIRENLQCRISPLNTLTDYKFVIVCTRYKDRWVLSRHKERMTYETQGGHIEAGETPSDAAVRELYEESGIRDADLYPVCDYCGYDDHGYANGVVFLAVAHSTGMLPESEMGEVKAFLELPQNLTYPNVSPKVFAEAERCYRKLVQAQR